MKRSKRIMLVCHCILNVNSKVEGLAEYEGVLGNIVKNIIDNGLGIIQLPCPELSCCGIKRWGMVKEQYDTPFYREHCRQLFKPYLQQIQNYISNGYKIDAVIGIDGSPSCGVDLTCSGDWGGELSGNPRAQEIIDSVRMVKGSGIFIEEIMKALEDSKIHVPFMAVDETNPEASFSKLYYLLGGINK